VRVLRWLKSETFSDGVVTLREGRDDPLTSLPKYESVNYVEASHESVNCTEVAQFGAMEGIRWA